MHIVVNFDTSNGTAGNRMRMYVNGSEVTAFSADVNPSLNADSTIMDAAAHYIGSTHTPSDYADVYLSEYIYIDGTQLDATSFGETDTNGNWIPVNPTGLTFGTNGFWLNFANSADLGNDVSGNNNDWTLNSITSANATNDNPADDAASDLGNYAALNPNNKDSNITLSQGNLKAENDAAAAWNDVLGTIGVSSGRWYWEMQHVFAGNGYDSFGIIGDSGGFQTLSTRGGAGAFVFDYNGADVRKYNESTTSATYWTGAHTTGDVIGFDLDADNQTLELIVGGTARGTVDISGIAAPYFPFSQIYQGGSVDHIYNFGQSAFANTPPSGAIAICTANLPAPAVANYEDEYYIEAGISHTNGATTAVTLPFDINTTGGMVRIKRTDSTGDWYYIDTARGGTTYSTNPTLASEGTFSDGGFSTNTFTISGDLATGTYLLDAFKVGSYFQIKTFTRGTGVQTVAWDTALDSYGMMAVFSRDNAQSPIVQHRSLTSGLYSLFLDGTGAELNRGNFDSAPDATNFDIGTSSPDINSGDYVAYAWANSGPYSFGFYTGNLSTDGPMLYGNGHPESIFFKVTSTTANWFFFDAQRQPQNTGSINELYLDLTNAESARSPGIDFVSTGVKHRAAYGGFNTSGATYVYGMFGITPIGGSGISQARAR